MRKNFKRSNITIYILTALIPVLLITLSFVDINDIIDIDKLQIETKIRKDAKSEKDNTSIEDIKNKNEIEVLPGSSPRAGEGKKSTKDVADMDLYSMSEKFPNYNENRKLHNYKNRKKRKTKQYTMETVMDDLMITKEPRRKRTEAKEQFYDIKPYAPKSYYRKKQLLNRYFKPSKDMYENWYSSQLWDKTEADMYVPQKETGDSSTSDYFEDDWSDLE